MSLLKRCVTGHAVRGIFAARGDRGLLRGVFPALCGLPGSARPCENSVGAGDSRRAGAAGFEIVPAEPYTDDYDTLLDIARDEQSSAARPALADTVDNWDEYDVIFIGYPIWWGIAAWPTDSFVEANDFTGKTVIPFCTSSSSGLGQSGDLLEELAGTGNWLEGQRFRGSTSEAEIQTWLDSLEL